MSGILRDPGDTSHLHPGSIAVGPSPAGTRRRAKEMLETDRAADAAKAARPKARSVRTVKPVKTAVKTVRVPSGGGVRHVRAPAESPIQRGIIRLSAEARANQRKAGMPESPPLENEEEKARYEAELREYLAKNGDRTLTIRTLYERVVPNLADVMVETIGKSINTIVKPAFARRDAEIATLRKELIAIRKAMPKTVGFSR